MLIDIVKYIDVENTLSSIIDIIFNSFIHSNIILSLLLNVVKYLIITK